MNGTWLMTTGLGRVEQVRDRAEDDDDARTQEREDHNQDDREHRQNQRIFNKGLPVLPFGTCDERSYKRREDWNHTRKAEKNHV